MKSKRTYDPEDIESLMLNKSFGELYPEEQKFVLDHLESEEEYEAMRRMLQDIRQSYRQDKWLEPEPAIREALLAEFAREEKKGFSIWLNNLFAMPGVPWYRLQGPRYALVVAGMLAGLFFWLAPSEEKFLAENKVSPSSHTAPAPPSEKTETLITDSVEESTSSSSEQQSSAETSVQMESPVPSPPPMEVDIADVPVQFSVAQDDKQKQEGEEEVVSRNIAGDDNATPFQAPVTTGAATAPTMAWTNASAPDSVMPQLAQAESFNNLDISPGNMSSEVVTIAGVQASKTKANNKEMKKALDEEVTTGQSANAAGVKDLIGLLFTAL